MCNLKEFNNCNNNAIKITFFLQKEISAIQIHDSGKSVLCENITPYMV